MSYIIKNYPVNYGLYKEMCGIVEKPEDIGMDANNFKECKYYKTMIVR